MDPFTIIGTICAVVETVDIVVKQVGKWQAMLEAPDEALNKLVLDCQATTFNLHLHENVLRDRGGLFLGESTRLSYFPMFALAVKGVQQAVNNLQQEIMKVQRKGSAFGMQYQYILSQGSFQTLRSQLKEETQRADRVMDLLKFELLSQVHQAVMPPGFPSRPATPSLISDHGSPRSPSSLASLSPMTISSVHLSPGSFSPEAFSFGSVPKGPTWPPTPKAKGTKNMAGKMMDAIVEKKVAKVEALLREGADPDKTSTSCRWLADARSPLHFATIEGHVEIVRLLLRYNATVDIKDKQGDTP